MNIKKTMNCISMRVHLINAISWAGVMFALESALPEFNQKMATIMITGFFLEMILIINFFRELRANNKITINQK